MSKETLQLMEGLRQGLTPFRDRYKDVPYAEELMNWYNRDGVLVDTKRIDSVMPTTLFAAIPPSPVIEVNEASWIQPSRDGGGAYLMPGIGYAPMGVFFEGWKSWPHVTQATYVWDPGDGTGTVTNGMNFAHVYETPGTYTATLTITSGTVSSSASYVVTVNATTGTTYYVDADAGSDSNDGKSEIGAWKTFNKAIDGMSSKRYVPGDRILFKRGQTFPALHTDFVSAHWQFGDGGYYFGAYGSGDKPIIKYSGASDVNGQLITSVSYGFHKVGFVDLDFDGASSTVGLIYASSYPNDILFLRCDFHDCGNGVIGNFQGFFLVDCTFDTSNSGVLVGEAVRRVGIMGCAFSNSSSHNVYFTSSYSSYIRGNTFASSAPSRHLLRISKGTNNHVFENTFTGVPTAGSTSHWCVVHFAANTPFEGAKHQDNTIFEYNTIENGDCQINIGDASNSYIRYNLLTGCSSLNNIVAPITIGSLHGYDFAGCANLWIYGNIVEMTDTTDTEPAFYIRDDDCGLYTTLHTGVAREVHSNVNIYGNVVSLSSTKTAFASRWAAQRAAITFTNNTFYKASGTNFADFSNLPGTGTKSYTDFMSEFEGNATGTTLNTGAYARPTIESLYIAPVIEEEEVTIVGLPQLFHGKGINAYCAGSTIYQAFVESELGEELGIYSSTYGAEEVSNGDFASGTGWSGAAWDIAGGKATPNTTSGTLTQTSVVEDGKVYKVTVEIDQNGSTAGYIQVALGTAAGRKLQVGGKFHEIIKSNGTSLVISYANSCRLALDSISVKELPTTTIEGNNRWEFAEFHNHFVLCNGIDLLYYIPGVGMVKLATGGISTCVARNRLIIVGNDIAPSLSSDYTEPEDPYTRTSRAVWWSSLNFADAHNRLLSGFSDTAIDDYELLGNQLLMNTGGSINLKTTHDDTVLQVLPFQDGFIVYCKYSIWKFSEVNDPISTYRIEKLADFGIPARGFAGGRTLEHVFIGMQGRLWRLSEKMELLDYRYYLEDLLEKTVWIEWESTENLYYICHENGSFILTAEGLFESNHRPNSITLIGGISTDVGTAAWTCETPWLTFGTNTQKSVLQLLVKTDNPSVWNWEVQAKTNPGSTIEVVSGTFGSNGKALVGITGLELKIRLSTATYGKLESAQVVWSDTEGVFI